jgi:hypothetical protein
MLTMNGRSMYVTGFTAVAGAERMAQDLAADPDVKSVRIQAGPDPVDDALDSARGLVYGTLLSVGLWVLIGGAVIWLFAGCTPAYRTVDLGPQMPMTGREKPPLPLNPSAMGGEPGDFYQLIREWSGVNLSPEAIEKLKGGTR